MKKLTLIFILTLLSLHPALADEGMWMVNSISKALVQNMEKKGLKLEAGEIYDADKVSIKDAIVSLGFYCSGSMISPRGLMITNHHCAYSDIHSISTKEHNYLEDGFGARSLEEEIPIPDKEFFFLQKVIDVTDEVNGIKEAEKLEGKPMGMRRLSHVIEKKYKEQTGLEASLSEMWAGSRYYLALYKVYYDVRLVAAPPVSIAAFGGDIDNWEWPQHKSDFSIYRIYTAPDGSPAKYSKDNVPMVPKRYLKISTDGYKPGDFTMVLGYPGTTDRYSSSAKVSRKEKFYPIATEIGAKKIEIINRWMNLDPDIRLKYSDKYFGLTNVQELHDGEIRCYKRFNVVGEKKAMEAAAADSAITAIVAGLEKKYSETEKAELNFTYYREALVRCTALGIIATRLSNRKKDFDIARDYSSIDMRVEKDLFNLAVKTYYENVDSSMWGPYQKELFGQFGSDAAKIAGFLWKDGCMTKADPIYKFFTDVKSNKFSQAKTDAENGVSAGQLNKKYTRRLYAWREAKGILQYPDANSTMRLTYGTVGTFRRDGKKMPWQTLSCEIPAKEDSTYEFTLKPEWREILSTPAMRSRKGSVPVDFITDNDITGGNSGSPVLNAKGELIGLAFDGNKESLAGDSSWTEGYNKSVNADIRFVLFVLKNYMKLDNIIKELETNGKETL